MDDNWDDEPAPATSSKSVRTSKILFSGSSLNMLFFFNRCLVFLVTVVGLLVEVEVFQQNHVQTTLMIIGATTNREEDTAMV